MPTTVSPPGLVPDFSVTKFPRSIRQWPSDGRAIGEAFDQRRTAVVETVAEAGRTHAFDVFLHLTFADRNQLAYAFVVFVLAAPEQNRQRFAGIRLGAGRVLRTGEDLPLRFVEITLDFFAALRRRFRHVAH